MNRGVAQLVERVVWDHEVAGASPVTPTIFNCFEICILFTKCLEIGIFFIFNSYKIISIYLPLSAN